MEEAMDIRERVYKNNSQQVNPMAPKQDKNKDL